ncbi:MAG: GNAT family N-acetyltransferase [Armatimonadetes bacterium]|nr:MAG: GNAT family N-acetyltransferase [Armatimonadota bacterium]
MSEIEYRVAEGAYADAMVELEHLCFPNLGGDDLLTVEGILLQEAVFPEGAFIALDGDRVIGMGSGIFVDYEISQPQHHMADVVGHEGVGNHDPDGDWYYGIDIAVHPDYRGRGIASKLYQLRKQVVIDHNKRGIIAGGVIPGFVNHKHEMTAAEYVEEVAAGRLVDATLTAQIRNGFEVRGVIADYVQDPTSDNWASFIVWFNPWYRDDETDDDNRHPEEE